MLDPEETSYLAVKHFTEAGKMVMFEPPLYYFINIEDSEQDTNPDQQSYTDVQIHHEGFDLDDRGYVEDYELGIHDFVWDDLYSDEHRARNERLMSMLSGDMPEDTPPNRPRINGPGNPHTLAMLRSEAHPGPGMYVDIRRADGTQYYSGNQTWWALDGFISRQATEVIDGDWLNDRGCGPVAFADLLAFHIQSDYSTFGDLLNYTDEPMFIFCPIILTDILNPDFGQTLENRVHYDASLQYFEREHFRVFMDYYAYLGRAPSGVGTTMFMMVNMFERLDRFTNFTFETSVPPSSNREDVERFIMLADEIKPIIEEIYPSLGIELMIRCASSNTIYGATWSPPWRGSQPQPNESFEWYQHSGIRVDEP